MIPTGHKQNFETLKRAFDHGNTCLMECRDLVSGQPAHVVCAINRQAGDYLLVPLARLFDNNPYEQLVPPTAEGSVDTVLAATSVVPENPETGDHRQGPEAIRQPLPPDPEGMNEKRAGWAGEARVKALAAIAEARANPDTGNAQPGATATGKQPTRVIITVEGGVVQNVYCPDPATTVEHVIVDYDLREGGVWELECLVEKLRIADAWERQHGFEPTLGKSLWQYEAQLAEVAEQVKSAD